MGMLFTIGPLDNHTPKCEATTMLDLRAIDLADGAEVFADLAVP
jgi:hypothetical protein